MKYYFHPFFNSSPVSASVRWQWHPWRMRGILRRQRRRRLALRGRHDLRLRLPGGDGDRHARDLRPDVLRDLQGQGQGRRQGRMQLPVDRELHRDWFELAICDLRFQFVQDGQIITVD